MDVWLLDNNSLRIKSKNAIFVVDPTEKISKTEADSIIVTGEIEGLSDSKVADSRVTIKGAGEYEVNGVKISGLRVNGNVVYNIDADNVKVVLGDGEGIDKVHDRIGGCDVAIVNAGSSFNHSVLTSLEPNVLVIYGEQKEEVRKSIGKETSPVSKYSITAEKLPEETELVLLE